MDFCGTNYRCQQQSSRSASNATGNVMSAQSYHAWHVLPRERQPSLTLQGRPTMKRNLTGRQHLRWHNLGKYGSTYPILIRRKCMLDIAARFACNWTLAAELNVCQPLQHDWNTTRSWLPKKNSCKAHEQLRRADNGADISTCPFVWLYLKLMVQMVWLKEM